MQPALSNECEIRIHILWRRHKSDQTEAEDTEDLVRLWKSQPGQRSFKSFFFSPRLKWLTGSIIQINSFLLGSLTFLHQKSTHEKLSHCIPPTRPICLPRPRCFLLPQTPATRRQSQLLKIKRERKMGPKETKRNSSWQKINESHAKKNTS